MCAQIAGHVSVHVAKAVKCSEGEVKDEATNDGKGAAHLVVPHLVHPHGRGDGYGGGGLNHICKKVNP